MSAHYIVWSWNHSHNEIECGDTPLSSECKEKTQFLLGFLYVDNSSKLK